MKKPDFSAFMGNPVVYPAPRFISATPGVKGVFMKGPDFRGRETRVFAWYALPEGADERHPVPGIVLVHGGLGTAYAPWAGKWASRGFAAIAVDQFCAIPKTDGSYGNMKPPKRHRYSGPVAEERFDHLDEPPEDQWGYHSIAAVMLANSFLRNLPEVDEDKVGITGISWGGYAAAIAAGVDPRYAFAMPVYGCGGFDTLALSDRYPQEKRDKFSRLWDPNRFLVSAKVPMLWTVGTRDFAFDVFNWRRSTRLAPDSYRSLKVDYPHGQYEGEDAPELLAFARAMTEDRRYTRFDDSTLRCSGNVLRSKLVPAEEMERFEVVWTRSTGCWNDRLFREEPATYDPATNLVRGRLPKNWTAAYLAAYGRSGLLYTSDVAVRGTR